MARLAIIEDRLDAIEDAIEQLTPGVSEDAHAALQPLLPVMRAPRMTPPISAPTRAFVHPERDEPAEPRTDAAAAARGGVRDERGADASGGAASSEPMITTGTVIARPAGQVPPPPPPMDAAPHTGLGRPPEHPRPSTFVPAPIFSPRSDAVREPVHEGSPQGIERFLGVKVAAWTGAVIVIIAIAIFAKFAIDKGWIGQAPPSLKLGLAYALSAAFIIAGGMLRERIGRVPSASLLAAGVGGLYVATCAGVSPLNIFGPAWAMAAGIAAGLIGAAVTWRSREVSVGAISLLGAYIVPAYSNTAVFLEASSVSQVTVVATYLTVIYAIALVLARIGPAGFAAYRAAGVLQAMAGVALVIAVGRSAPHVSIGFTALWWGMAVAECFFAALQGRSARVNTGITIGATFIAATLALRGAFAPNPWIDFHSWLPLAMAGACIAGSIVLRGMVPGGKIDDQDMRDDPLASQIARTCAEQAFLLAVLAAALVMAQVGVLVHDGALPVTWSVMGAAGIFLGRRLARPNVARCGFASLVLAMLATVVLMGLGTVLGGTLLWQYPADGATGESMWAVRLHEGFWSPVIVSLALLLSARWWSAGRDPAGLPTGGGALLAAAAALLWSVLSFMCCSNYAALAALLAVPVAALFVGRTLILVRVIAMGWSALVAAGWVVVTVAVVFDGPSSTLVRPQGGAVMAALIVGSFATISRKFRHERFGQVAMAIGFAFGLCAMGMLLFIEANSATADGMTRSLLAAAMAISVVGTAGAITARRAALEMVEGVGLVAATLSAIAWLYVLGAVALAAPTATTWTAHWLANLPNLAALPMAACMVALRIGYRDDRRKQVEISTFVVIALTIFSSSIVWRFFEPALAPFESSTTLQHSTLSVWLALVGVGLVIAGFRKRSDRLRWSGLVLLGAIALKVLILDMANAGTIWRVLALLAIGLLLVVTSVLYSRAIAAEAKEGRKGQEGRNGEDSPV